MGRVSAEKRRAAVERLSLLREDKTLPAPHIRTVADALVVSERTVWRWLAPPKPTAPAVRPRYELSETDRAALASCRDNVAAVVRARRAVTDGDGTTAGAAVPDFLAERWASGEPVAERTLYRAFAEGLAPAERATWKSGEAGRRAGSIYLRRPDALRAGAGDGPQAAPAARAAAKGQGTRAVADHQHGYRAPAEVYADLLNSGDALTAKGSQRINMLILCEP
ncbi:hypothetical protein [Streptomyces sp. TE33382]